MRKEQSFRRPLGICVDIGAPMSVVGRSELNRMLTASGVYNSKRRLSPHRFRFGDVSFKSRGIATLPLSTPDGVPPIEVDFDIVDADVPALLGQDVLDRERLTADTVFHWMARRTVHQDGKSKTM